MGDIGLAALGSNVTLRSEGPSWWRQLVPVWVNFIIGLPAMVPLHSAWLLLTEYRSCAFNNTGFQSHCGSFGVIEGAGWARGGVVIFGGLGVLLVVAVDVLFPAAYGRRVRPWLLGMLVIPVPYLIAIAALALVG
ncbi:hypothetical protein ASD51_31615 [Streptomyces sp. Root55]|nr:hypothetical protein ASD51_31615 [Streptomyces sp. Root55]